MEFEDVVGGGTRRQRFGTVRAFDAERGLGLVAVPGGAVFEFHSTAILDGSRQVAVGSEVTFLVTASLGGRYEAVSLRPA